MTDLVKKAQKGDAEAFVLLMNGQKQGLYRIALSYLRRDADAADALQETVLACWEKLPGLREAKYFKTWCTRILINVCNDLLRERDRCDTVDRLPEAAQQDPEQENAEFLALLDALNEKYRTVLLLYYGEGYNAREIAGLLNLKEETVKTRLKRGREQFRKVYEEEST